MRLIHVRNILNTLFIIVAAIGMYMYYKGNRETATYVIIASMAFKFVELCLRIIYKDND